MNVRTKSAITGSDRQPLSALIAILMMLALIMSTNVSANWQLPLNRSEVAQAAVLVTAAIKPTPTQRSMPMNDHPLGSQIVLIELREEKNPSDNTARLAEVFVFNYLRQTSELHLVDVVAQRILRSTDIESPHLPLSDTEITYAENLALDDADVNRKVVLELSRLQDESDTAVQSRVAIWVPDSPSQAGDTRCHLERCALVSLFTDSERSLTIEPVINLITGKVFVSRNQ